MASTFCNGLLPLYHSVCSHRSICPHALHYSLQVSLHFKCSTKIYNDMRIMCSAPSFEPNGVRSTENGRAFFAEPDFSTTSREVTLLKPCKEERGCPDGRPLFVYAPGLDCTGRGIRKQLFSLYSAGYDVRCVYIPSTDRSSWKKLVDKLIPLLVVERQCNRQNRHITLMGESFGAVLALRLAHAAPKLISRIILVNSATNFKFSNPLASFFAETGLLATLPEIVYKFAQDILLALMVKHNLVSRKGIEDILSPIDYVPADCAAWRFMLLNNDAGLLEDDIRSIYIPTLVIASAEDRALSSLAEGARLQGLLQNAKRVILPHSGHTVLLEDCIDLVAIMKANGLQTPNSALPSSHEQDAAVLRRKRAVPDEVLDEMGYILAPWRFLTSPLLSGEENLPNPAAEPRRPVLFVGNHTMFGGYDTPIMLYELFLRGFHGRGLAHPGHWDTIIGPIFERYGHVKASKFNAYHLLQGDESVLLFPGGAREVFKNKGESYKLMWKATTDFVRMASRFKAIIVPFAALGGDDAFTVLIDSKELLESPIGPFVQELCSHLNINSKYIPPLTSLPGTILPSPFPIPSLERIYFHFAEPIDTASYSKNLKNRKEFATLYSLVQRRVEESIDKLQQIRMNDPERNLQPRLASKILSVVSHVYRT